MVDMVKDITEAAGTVTRMAEVLKDYEGLRAQFNNVLDLLLLGDGHDLLPLHGQDWPVLKDQVTGWVAEQLERQEYGHRLRQTIVSGAGRVDVEVEHLLDDYWWVRPPRPGPTRMTPPWPCSASWTASTPGATGRVTRPASPDRTERGSRRHH